MPITELDERTAVVLIDLQRGIVETPAIPNPAATVVANAARLARAFRAKGLPVVLVRVDWSADNGDRLHARVETPMPTGQPPHWADLMPELDPRPDDIVITKRQWGAFHGTELDRPGVERYTSAIIPRSNQLHVPLGVHSRSSAPPEASIRSQGYRGQRLTYPGVISTRTTKPGSAEPPHL